MIGLFHLTAIVIGLFHLTAIVIGFLTKSAVKISNTRDVAMLFFEGMIPRIGEYEGNQYIISRGVAFSHQLMAKMLNAYT